MEFVVTEIAPELLRIPYAAMWLYTAERRLTTVKIGRCHCGAETYIELATVTNAITGPNAADAALVAPRTG
jgi:hypothetical protein